MGRSLVIIAGVIGVLLPAAASARLRLDLKAEAGPELDTNANRVQPIEVPCPSGSSCVNNQCYLDSCGDPTDQSCWGDTCNTTPEDPITSGLFRIIASGALVYRFGRQVLSASYGGGTKVFLGQEAREADELVHQGRLGWATLLSPGVLSVEGSFYDAYERESARDFRTGAAVARLALGRRAEGLAITSAVGYRGLQYKPLPDYSFHGPQAGIELASTIGHGDEVDPVDWNLYLSYWISLRRYSGNAEDIPLESAGCQGSVCNRPSDSRRDDLNHTLRAEVNYLGNADATLWYSLEVNQSNSHGETLKRHIVGLKFTAPLVWGVYLSVKGVLQFSAFRDPYLISRTHNESLVNIEDENRSRLVLQLARDLTSHLAVNLRYSLYINESVTQADEQRAVRVPEFRRQTLFLGLRFEYGR